jgi:long-chain acyl-CoA synthetase
VTRVFNLAVTLRESARRTPDKPAVTWDGGQLTYAEIDSLSDVAAAGLRARGISPGDTVGLQLPNIPQFVIAYFGILKAGGVVVPMNVLLRAPEIAFYLADSQAKILITFAMFLDQAAAGAAEAGVTEVYAVGIDAPTSGAQAIEALLGAATGDAGNTVTSEIVPREADDTAVIIYTSGTTGKPKGAELTHFTLYMNCDIPGRLFEMAENDVCLTVLPLFHVFGLSSIMNGSVRFGGTMSLIPRFDAEAVLQAIERDKATIFMGVPTMYVGLLAAKDLEKYDLSSLRIAVSGGAPIPAEVIDSFESTFGVTILEGYGLSETASTTTFNISAEERKIYSVGKPIWGVEVQIWDPQHNQLPVGKDHVGELVIRGFNVMKAYYNNPAATEKAFEGGWFHTGDLGYVDEDGFFFIVDRMKELIIRGGYNVYPREVEDVLYAHPAIAECAVIGIPDDRLGEEVQAIVCVREGMELTEDEVIAYAKDRLAAYKYPRSVRFMSELPKGGTGKILKKELKAQLAG